MTYENLSGSRSLMSKRTVFVSYHHGGDQRYYDEFARLFCDTYDMIYDNSLERQIDSDDVDYVLRRIRENYITGSSCTVVLVGSGTWGRKYVDWEIDATLQKEHGLLGLQLPTAPMVNGGIRTPGRFHDNVVAGYAVWRGWADLVGNPQNLKVWIEQANNKNKSLMRNGRQRRLRNEE